MACCSSVTSLWPLGEEEPIWSLTPKGSWGAAGDQPLPSLQLPTGRGVSPLSNLLSSQTSPSFWSQPAPFRVSPPALSGPTLCPPGTSQETVHLQSPNPRPAEAVCPAELPQRTGHQGARRCTWTLREPQDAPGPHLEEERAPGGLGLGTLPPGRVSLPCGSQAAPPHPRTPCPHLELPLGKRRGFIETSCPLRPATHSRCKASAETRLIWSRVLDVSSSAACGFQVPGCPQSAQYRTVHGAPAHSGP